MSTKDLVVAVANVALASTPVQAIPYTLPEWRWAGLVYFCVVARWPFTTACRRIAARANEHIRCGVVAAVTAGEHWDSVSVC